MFISVVTLGEIEYGARSSHVPDPAKQAEYAAMDAAKIKFVLEQCPEPMEITKHVAEQYGEMRAWLFNHCAPNKKKSKKRRAEELVYPITAIELGIDENDIWIAAQAMTLSLVLVTRDSRGNFATMLNQFAPTLVAENWAT
jgi:predicted nucleic acid-binding protein